MLTAIEKEVERNLARGDKRVSNFTGAQRSLENLGLEKGDTFTFPNDYEVYEQKIGTSTAQYILIELTNGKVKPFYPSTFTKSRAVYNEDLTLTGQRVYTTGTAAELYRQYPTVEEGMNALKGITITVKDIMEVRTLRYGTQELINAQMPVLELVEKKDDKSDKK